MDKKHENPEASQQAQKKQHPKNAEIKETLGNIK